MRDHPTMFLFMYVHLFWIKNVNNSYFNVLVGHTSPTVIDVTLAFRDLGINLSELEEYVEYVASVPCSVSVPKFPVERESHLNLLKPGSREVVTRPVHIHEHLPAMHPELEGRVSHFFLLFKFSFSLLLSYSNRY